MKALRLAAAMAAASLVLGSGAQAAQRYVVPSSSGPESEGCTQAEPCSLKVGVGDANTNDEVILAAGTYEVDALIAPKPGVENVHVHGALGGSMPMITGKTAISPPISGGSGGRLAYLDIVNEASGAFGIFCVRGSVERVRVRVVGGDAVGIAARAGCTVRDILVHAAGNAAKALEGGASSGDGSAVARNVTAIATGPGSVGIASSYAFNPLGPGSVGTFTLDLKNAIASGGKADLEAADTLGFGGAAKLIVAHSNFDVAANGPNGTVIDAGGNQTAPPLFLDAAAGDYREGAGSPTIDAGVNDQLSPLDLDGNARLLGAAPDIGAFEFVPPPASVGAAAGAVIQSLAVAPKTFRAGKVGGAVISARKGRKAPVASTVTYNLSAAATVAFSVERKVSGRRVGKRCVKKTKANATKRKCSLFRPVRGGFSHTGAAGGNRFKFSGRLAKALTPGSYRLTGKTSASSRAANFRIVK
jgi:putative NIF3 family GTP cyclohydrolase 1 type 2